MTISQMDCTDTSPSYKSAFLDKWDARFLRVAHEVETWSKDPRRKVGCVIVRDKHILATGCNGFPKNLSDDLSKFDNKEYKLKFVIHAEANAIYNASEVRSSINASTAYITFPPCCTCASALAQNGVIRVVCPDPKYASKGWIQNCTDANEMLYEAGLTVHYYTEADYLK